MVEILRNSPSPGAPISVLVVDDHPLLREGVAGAINDEPTLRLAGEAASGAEAVAAFRTHRPDVTLMDMRLPDMSGIDAMAAILRDCPQARVVILSTYAGDAHVERAMKAGAAGYLHKGLLRKDLVSTLQLVHAGRRHVAGEVAASLAEHLGESPLSNREISVLRLVAQGFSNKRVAAHFALSEETVKAHMKSILSKLSATDRTHAVTIALRRGIIDI